MQEKIINEILNNSNNHKYNYLIIKLLKENKLDNLTNKITNDKTTINITTLQKKESLTGIEQFLMLLSNTIYFFKENFYFLNNNIDYIISILLQDKENTKYLLCKKYIGDNKNIEYYNYYIKKLITNSYYNNLIQLSKKSPLIKDYLYKLKLNKKDTKENIEIIFNSLINISLCNATISNNVLFENINDYIKDAKIKYQNKNIQNQIETFFAKEYEKMINNYYEKKDIIKILLK